MRKLRVGILGATGAVGQHMVIALQRHPWFEITEVAASDRSVGFAYAERVAWRMSEPIPEPVGRLRIKECAPPLECDFVLAALSAELAKNVEYEFAAAGCPVVSNSSYYRMHERVPLVIPEINADHLRILPHQQKAESFGRGFIVTNPNCTTIGLCLPLAPLHRRFGLEKVFITSMQAISGAGYTGLHALDIFDNVLPHIDGEEPKVVDEPKKILGKLHGDAWVHEEFAVSAQCNRVPVEDGHTICVSVGLRNKPSLEEVKAAMREFRGLPQEVSLPTAPAYPVIVSDENNRPQPRLDLRAGGGMTCVVGRLRPCEILDYKFVTLSHNLIRGAAGAALLNAELLYQQGYLR
ncbi:MAG: aspartate-semialdehyde dehydrogenase [Acidobacteria bacterium]|nr:aspartate-semialdehyde dehydrogenase [Acidobacteriota bacterium]MBI3657356.1 aspartate-semialdehyde dehydrogenase [Acidobacteriota bacterium]